jgi:hypothetical protein
MRGDYYFKPFLPELVRSYEREGQFFGVVRITRRQETRLYEFGLDAASYRSFQRMLQLRPLDQLPGLPHRYFFVPSVSRTSEPSYVMATVRVEQGDRAKACEVRATPQLVANLLWFFQLQDFSEASHLRQLESGSAV